MVKTRGKGWGVPEQYAGTPENNYAQRAVVSAMPDIGNLIQAEVVRRI
jgi:hypothetical protein